MVNALSLCSLLLLSLSVNAAVTHNARRAHSRGDVSLIRRSTDPNSRDAPLFQKRSSPPSKNNRRLNKRCNAKTTSATSSPVPSTTIVSDPTSTTVPASSSVSPTVALGNVGGKPVTTSESVKPVETTSSSEPVEPTSSAKPTTARMQTVTTTKAPETTAPHTTSTKAAAPTTSVASGGSSLLTGTKSGQGTFYSTGLNACGGTDKDTDMIAAVSHILYDEFPGATANSNLNPICGRSVTASRGGQSVTVKITDRCAGCAQWDLDFSPSAFDKLASEDLGRVDITWVWN